MVIYKMYDQNIFGTFSKRNIEEFVSVENSILKR